MHSLSLLGLGGESGLGMGKMSPLSPKPNFFLELCFLVGSSHLDKSSSKESLFLHSLLLLPSLFLGVEDGVAPDVPSGLDLDGVFFF